MMKRRLQERVEKNGGRPLLGLTVTWADPTFIDVVGRIGIDCIWLDQEHTHITTTDTHTMCLVANAHDLVKIVRVPGTGRDWITKTLECGPDVIICPITDTVEDIEKLVKHSRYRPVGQRGMFSALPSANYAIGGLHAQQFEKIDQQLTVYGQIESATAVENLDAMCQVEGIDGFLIGRFDLSADLGVPTQLNHPEVMKLVEKSVEILRLHGKEVAMLGGPDELPTFRELGATFVIISNQTALIRDSTAKLLEQCRGQLQ